MSCAYHNSCLVLSCAISSLSSRYYLHLRNLVPSTSFEIRFPYTQHFSNIFFKL